MTDKLRALGDKLAIAHSMTLASATNPQEAAARAHFKAGFDAAVRELWPVVEALQFNMREWEKVANGPEHLTAYQKASHALSSVGVGGEK